MDGRLHIGSLELEQFVKAWLADFDAPLET